MLTLFEILTDTKISIKLGWESKNRAKEKNKGFILLVKYMHKPLK